MAEADTFKEIQRLLAAGETQAAADLASSAEADAVKADAAARGEEAPLPPPRSLESITLDFMNLVAQRYGNHHQFRALIDEFQRGSKEHD